MHYYIEIPPHQIPFELRQRSELTALECVRELGLPPIGIRWMREISYLEFSEAEKTGSWTVKTELPSGGIYLKSTQPDIFVNFQADNYNSQEIQNTICHECRHAYQYFYGSIPTYDILEMERDAIAYSIYCQRRQMS
jgi:hypothetical protein